MDGSWQTLNVIPNLFDFVSFRTQNSLVLDPIDFHYMDGQNQFKQFCNPKEYNVWINTGSERQEDEKINGFTFLGERFL